MFTAPESWEPSWSLKMYVSTWMNVDWLGLGAALAVLFAVAAWRKRMEKYLWFFVPPIGVIGVAAPFVLRGTWLPKYLFQGTALALVFCSLVHATARGFRGIPGAILKWRPMVYIGKSATASTFITSSRFRFSPGFLVFGGWELRRTGVMGILAAAGVILLIASLSWRFFESPINDLKNRFQTPALA